MVPEEDETVDGDVFAPKEQGEEPEHGRDTPVPDTFEELPIEIRSLTERYISSCMLFRAGLTLLQISRIPHS